jgi:hypothetical protein
LLLEIEALRQRIGAQTVWAIEARRTLKDLYVALEASLEAFSDRKPFDAVSLISQARNTIAHGCKIG